MDIQNLAINAKKINCRKCETVKQRYLIFFKWKRKTAIRGFLFTASRTPTQLPDFQLTSHSWRKWVKWFPARRHHVCGSADQAVDPRSRKPSCHFKLNGFLFHFACHKLFTFCTTVWVLLAK